MRALLALVFLVSSASARAEVGVVIVQNAIHTIVEMAFSTDTKSGIDVAIEQCRQAKTRGVGGSPWCDPIGTFKNTCVAVAFPYGRAPSNNSAAYYAVTGTGLSGSDASEAALSTCRKTSDLCSIGGQMCDHPVPSLRAMSVATETPLTLSAFWEALKNSSYGTASKSSVWFEENKYAALIAAAIVIIAALLAWGAVTIVSLQKQIRSFQGNGAPEANFKSASAASPPPPAPASPPPAPAAKPEPTFAEKVQQAEKARANVTKSKTFDL